LVPGTVVLGVPDEARFLIKILAQALQTCRIDKSRQLHAAHLNACGHAG